jgi:MFS family permease
MPHRQGSPRRKFDGMEEEATGQGNASGPWWRRLRQRHNWLTRDVGLVVMARVFMSASRALAGVVVPIYLALIGFNAVELGALFVAVALMSAVLSALVGFTSDRIGRKPFLIILPLCAAGAAVVFALTRDVLLIFLFAALGSFGRGAGAGAGMIGPYQPAEQAMLADAVPHRARNTLFGLLGFMSSLGALIGGGPLAALPDALPLLGLARGLASYQVTFLVLAGLAAIAGLLAVPIANSRPAPRPKNVPQRHISRTTWPLIIRLWITNSVNGLAVGFFGPFITYWFFVRFGAGPGLIGALYSIINLGALVSNLFAAPVARRLGLVRTIVIGRSLQAILMIPMVLAPTFWVAGAWYFVRMLAQRMALPLRQSYVMGMAPPAERGIVGALSNLPTQATSAISPGVAGAIFNSDMLALPFEIGAALQGLNALLFFLFFRHMQPPEERQRVGQGHPAPEATGGLGASAPSE